MNVTDNKGTQIEDERLEAAAEWFLRVRAEPREAETLPGLQKWIEADSRNFVAYQQVLASWGIVGEYANAPEIVVVRRDALDDSRKVSEERFSTPRSTASGLAGLFRHKGLQAALAAGLLAVLAAGWWLMAPHSRVYETERGEQTNRLLADGSSISLDADSRVRVRYTDGAREVTLERGQARFTVAKDVVRPFRVRARGQTVVALGTQFDVDLIAHSVRVILIEGSVAVAGVSHDRNDAGAVPALPIDEPAATKKAAALRSAARAVSVSDGGVVEMKAGQVLRVRDDGGVSRLADIDLARATAWNSGKLFFDNEPLSSAVERINRYSREQIFVDPGVADVAITGVFNAGDTDAFIEAVTNYFAVDSVRDRGGKLRLTHRRAH
jgi:transmembrane sensor